MEEDKATEAHLAGIPDTLPPQWCPNCKAEVVPRGKGLCPRCGRVLKNSFLSRKHPVNLLRRDQLHAENVAEYQPDTLHLRRACRWLANVTERLEKVKDGTPEHQRLVEMWTRLTATLEESRMARAAQPASDLSTLTNDQLVARTETLLAKAKSLRDQPPSLEESFPSLAKAEGSGEGVAKPGQPFASPREACRASPLASGLPPKPEPEPCPYCHESLADCADLRTARPDVWRDLHFDHPELIEERRQRATAEMFESLRRFGPAKY